MFLTNYDVTRVERKTAEYAVISSSLKKPAQNREKSTNGDYSCPGVTSSTSRVELCKIFYIIFIERNVHTMNTFYICLIHITKEAVIGDFKK